MNDNVPSQRVNKGRDLLERWHPLVCLAIPAFYRIAGLSIRHFIFCLGIVPLVKIWSLRLNTLTRACLRAVPKH